MREVWRWVSGYQGLYEVSNLGRLRSYYRKGRRNSSNASETPLVMKPYVGVRGYRLATLRKDGIPKNIPVHSLVVSAFYGEVPRGKEVRHRDGNKTNNRLDNLIVGTRAENEADKVRHGVSNRGSRNGMSVLTEQDVKQIKSLLKRRIPHSVIAHMFGVSQPVVTSINTGKAWKHVS